MVIPIVPEAALLAQALYCIVCRRPVGWRQACTGAAHEGLPAFACDQHLSERARRSQWIVSWADSQSEGQP